MNEMDRWIAAVAGEARVSVLCGSLHSPVMDGPGLTCLMVSFSPFDKCSNQVWLKLQTIIRRRDFVWNSISER